MRVAGRNLFLGLPFNAARIIPGVTGPLNPLLAVGAKFLSIHMVVGHAPRRERRWIRRRGITRVVTSE
jgi:cation transport ATPase